MGSVEIAIDQNIATLTLNSPATRNALDPALAGEVVEACDLIERRSDVGAAVVRGAGGTFCSGAVREVLAHAGEDPAEPGRFDELGFIYEAFTRIGTLRVPTVAAACGAVVGAGVNLLLATDLRIVAQDARILSGFMRIGIHPGGGHFTLLGRAAGPEAAAAIGLFGEEVSGTRARELGLAWDAVPSAQVDTRARELAARVAADPELARRALASLRGELGPPMLPWPAAVAVERGPQMWSLRRRHGSNTAG